MKTEREKISQQERFVHGEGSADLAHEQLPVPIAHRRVGQVAHEGQRNQRVSDERDVQRLEHVPLSDFPVQAPSLLLQRLELLLQLPDWLAAGTGALGPRHAVALGDLQVDRRHQVPAALEVGQLQAEKLDLHGGPDVSVFGHGQATEMRPSVPALANLAQGLGLGLQRRKLGVQLVKGRDVLLPVVGVGKRRAGPVLVQIRGDAHFEACTLRLDSSGVSALLEQLPGVPRLHAERRQLVERQPQDVRQLDMPGGEERGPVL